MRNAFRGMVAVVLMSMAVGSCTCHCNGPEPPDESRSRPGFKSALPTRRSVNAPRVEAPLQLSRATPRPAPSMAPTEPTPPEDAQLPEDFPSDIPLYEGAEPFAVQQLAGNARNVLFRVDADGPEVFRYYRENMTTNGWNVTQEYQHKDQSFLSFQKGQTITNMTVAKDPRTGKQIIAIMYYEEEPLPFDEF